MRTKVHGCWFAPLGASAAARIAFTMSSRGTGSGEKSRIERRLRMVARKRSDAAERSSSVSSTATWGRRGSGMPVMVGR